MAPWGFLLTGAACAVFPQHKGVILVVSAVGSLVRGGRRREAQLAQEQPAGSADGAPGGAGGVTLEWGELECFLKDKKSGARRKDLLTDLWGSARPGRLLAIMGPSGAGKTTLLNVLANQLPASAPSGTSTCLHGTVTVDGVPSALSRHKQAYIRQEDMFFSNLTVRETLLFAAKLQLPGDLSEAEKEATVEKLLKTMGLSKVQNTVVGNAKVRGVSGGERKRLSIACELLGNPALVFADEPTTGLDAFQAEKVMENLRALAHDQGKTVVCSIHQPRGSVYDKFDDIILLSEGKLVYFGPAGDAPLQHFRAAGIACPDHSNPAEFLADSVGIDHSTPETEEATEARLKHLVGFFAFHHPPPALLPRLGASTENEGAGAKGTKQKKKGLGFVAMFKLLLSRAWKQAVRDKSTNFVRATMNVTSALIFGAVFWRMGLSQTSIQDRMGLLQVAAINTAMASLTETVNVFPTERQIAQREIGKGAYSVSSYFCAKLAAELPISAVFPALFGFVMYPMTGLNKSISRFLRFLMMTSVESFTSSAMGLTVGCLAPSTEAAMALGPSIMTVFIVFGGYYVNADNTPFLFRWIPNVSLIRWAFQGLCENEFTGLRFEASKPGDLATGEQVLARLSFDVADGGSDGGSVLQRALRKEAGILAFWYWASLFLLQRKRAKYTPLLPPLAPLPRALSIRKVDDLGQNGDAQGKGDEEFEDAQE